MMLMSRAMIARLVVPTIALSVMFCSALSQTDGSAEVVAPSANPDTALTDSRTEIRPSADRITGLRDSVAEPGQVVFSEIELSPEGVTAMDTAGYRWTYDHGQELFVIDRSYSRANRPFGSSELAGEIVEPVERRCTEELVLGGLAAKPVFVGYNEYVNGDIKAYDRVTVKGWVKGGIQSIRGRVLVTATGKVDGDIRAPEIEVKEGGVVLGRTYPTEGFNLPVDVITSSFSADGIWIVLGIALFLLLAAFLSVSLAAGPLKTISECIDTYPVKSLLLGLLTLFLLTPSLALLVVTVVGVLALPIVLLVVIPVALIAGMAASLHQVLRGVLRGRQGTPGHMFLSLAGVLVYTLFWMLVAVLLGSNGAVAQGFGYFVLVLTIMLTTYPLLIGMGAVVLTRFGFRKYVGGTRQLPLEGAAAPAPAPPPMPGLASPVPPQSDPANRAERLRRPPYREDRDIT